MTRHRILLISCVLGLTGLIVGWQAATGGAPAPSHVRIVSYYWLGPTPPGEAAPQSLKEGVNEVGPQTFVVVSKPPATQPAGGEAEQLEMVKHFSAANAEIAAHLNDNYLAKGWKISSVQGAIVQQAVTFYLVPEK